MDNKRKALGLGLEQLFNNKPLDMDEVEKEIIENTDKKDIIEINLSELKRNPYQPRKKFDESKLEELALSIKEHGVFQPIIVKKSIKGYYIIVGERRAKASKMAGKSTIPAIIRDFTDSEMMEIALLENIQREDLSAIEEAEAYKNIIDALGLTQEELAKKIGKSRSYITNMLGLLELPSSVKQMIQEDKISMSHARALSKIKNPEDIESLANKIINEGLNVRDIENITKNDSIEKKHKITTTRQTSEYKELESIMSDKLGTKVKIKNRKLEINFTNHNDLNRILEIINIKL